MKILLVEDEPIAQIIAKFAIEEAGHQLDIVKSPEQASSTLQNTTYDLILMDLGLPNISGVEFADNLIHKLKITTPIIAITAFNPDSKKAECIKTGFKGFIEKPFTTKQLEDIINNFSNQ